MSTDVRGTEVDGDRGRATSAGQGSDEAVGGAAAAADGGEATADGAVATADGATATADGGEATADRAVATADGATATADGAATAADGRAAATSTADELAGLDALQLSDGTRGFRARLWSGVWPKVAAIALALLIWQVVVWSGWRPKYIFPGPGTVFSDLLTQLGTGQFWASVGVTGKRAAIGFAAAVAIGLVLGFAVARFAPLRAAIGSLITGLQTMPSIAWFPLAIVLFGLDENAIFFVVVLGAAPSIANGVLAGVDYVPTILVRAGRNLGATGFSLYRTVIGPASLPAIVSGLKQGWAFSWRSLMAGELLVVIGENGSLGSRLQYAREFSDYSGLLGTMVVILVLGILADAAFTAANNAIRRRWGLIDA